MNLTKEEFGLRGGNIGEEGQNQFPEDPVPEQLRSHHEQVLMGRNPILQTQLAANILELGLQALTEKG